MSNGTQESQGPTPPTNSPPDVIDAAMEAARKEAEKRAKELADFILQQQGPAGTPSLHKK